MGNRVWRHAHEAVTGDAGAGDAIARIEEKVRLTFWGTLCLVLLLIVVALALKDYARATTVFQQIEAAVSLIAGSILFGLGVALGRRRTYTVHRAPPTNEV